MAYKCREEIVGKRFLSVRSPTKLKVSKISEWEWRSGVVRAVSSRDAASVEFTVLVEFEDVEWKRREWIRVHESFQVFLVEHTLVWTSRPGADKDLPSPLLPCLCFKPIVDKCGFAASKKRVVEFLVDRDLAVVEDDDIQFYQEGDENRYESVVGNPELQKAVKAWVDYQDAQRILLTTPTVLVGYRVEVYRAEGTTQWYTAVIQSYNPSTKSLTITDDTVLEEHNEDPALVQMQLIDDGVVDSILRGVEVGIAPRRRPRNSQPSKDQTQTASGRRQAQQSTSQSTKHVATKAVTKVRQISSSTIATPEPVRNTGQEKLNSRSRSQASEKRKRKSDVPVVDAPSPRSSSPNKRVKGSASDPEGPSETDNLLHIAASACREGEPSREQTANLGIKQIPSTTATRPPATRDKTNKSQRQKAGSKGSNSNTTSCEQDDSASAGAPCSSDSTSVESPVTASGGFEVSKKDEKVHQDLGTSNSTPATPAIDTTQVTEPCLSQPSRGRECKTESKETTRVKKGPGSRKNTEGRASPFSSRTTSSRHVADRVSEARPTAAVTSQNVDTKAPSAPDWDKERASRVSSEVSEIQQLPGQAVKSEEAEDNMHYKKQLLLQGGNNSPSSSAATQPASLSHSIDVNRPVTDQLTKLAKTEKFVLGGDGKSDTDSSTTTTETAVAPSNTVSFAGETKPEKTERESSKAHNVNSDRQREASAFTCVKSNASQPQSNPSEDRADSRASDSVVYTGQSDDRRPGSRLDDLRSVKSSPTSSPLVIDRSEPVNPYRDPELMSKNTVRSSLTAATSLHKTMSGPTYPSVPGSVPAPTGLTTSTTLASHPSSMARSMIPPGLPYHQLPPGAISHPPLTHGFSQLDALAARELAAAQQQQHQLAIQQYQNAHLMQLPYALPSSGHRVAQLELLWQQKFPQAPIPPAWLLAKQSEALLGETLLQREQLERLEQERLERERIEKRLELERMERDRMERAERERRERKEKERIEREKAEKEKQERERAERERLERERLEKERQERERLEWECQRQERERILREAADTSAAVDQHFNESLSRLANQRGIAQSMWPTPSITKGTGKGVLGKTEAEKGEDERMKRDLERERYLGMLEQRGDHKPPEGVRGKDGKPIPSYPPFHFGGPGYPLTTSGTPSSSKPEAIFSLYGYQNPYQHQHSTITTEQLQKKGLAPGAGRPVKEEKGHYVSHPSNPSPPRASHMTQHPKDIKPQGVIVENKLKMENPVTAHSHHHNTAPLSSSSSSSPRPQPRPAHTPEQRPDRQMPPSANLPHHLMNPSSIPSSSSFMSQPPTAFRSMDPKAMSRSQSPYKAGHQHPAMSSQQQQVASQPQPIDYCKTSAKGKASTGPPPPNSSSGSGSFQPAVAQPPVSLPATSLAYSYSLIQQGLVPNPMYSQGSLPPSMQLARTQAGAPLPAPAPTSAALHNSHPGGSPAGPPPPPGPTQPGKPSQHSPSGTASKRKSQTAGRDNGSMQSKRTKAATSASGMESDPGRHRTPPSVVSVPVTTPQIITNQSPYTTNNSMASFRASVASAASGSSGNPAVGTLSGFMDSFKSFVENTVQNAFLQDERTAREREERERSQKQQELKPQQQAVSAPEKMDTTPSSAPKASNEEKTSSPLPPSAAPPSLSASMSSSMASIMDTINRVANGQVDTDSDTLSAPSPPPSQARPDASPHSRGAAGGSGGATAPKLKKAWLQRHSDEDKKPMVSPSPLVLAQEDSNSSQSTSREVKHFLQSSGATDSSSVVNGEGTASPAPTANLPNGNITDLRTTNDESTSSASETESQNSAAKKRSKSKKSTSSSKKVKSEDRTLSPVPPEPQTGASNPRKKNSNKRTKTDTKENPKAKEKIVQESTPTPPPPSSSTRTSGPGSQPPSSSPSPTPSATSTSSKKGEEKSAKSSTSKQSRDRDTSNSPKPQSHDRERERERERERSPDPASSNKDKKKTRRSKESPKESAAKNGSSFNKPLVKYSLATLKRTGTPFIQDGPCSEVTPKLSKCRECKMTPTQRSKKLPNIFCRFYAFRRLKFSAKGAVTIAGFSELSDADPDDIEPWLPRFPIEDPQLDEEMSKFILAKVGDKFCELVEQEKEAKSWAGDDAKIAWKRAVTGVREMCDVCDTTLFNMHWVCHKCGFVVCLDCYKAKMKLSDSKKGSGGDECKWLTCSSNRQAHEAEKLMLTQIIPSDALWELGRLIHEIRRKWSIPAKCTCGQNTIDSKAASKNGMNPQMVKKLMNGVSEESGKKSKKGASSHQSGEEEKVEQEEYNQDSLALLANVALRGDGDKPNKRFSKDKLTEEELLGEDGDKKSSCSTLRELLTKTAGKGKVPSEKKSKPKSSGSTLDDIIQSVVERSCRDMDQSTQPFKFLHYIPRLGQWNRELPIITHNLTETSVLYPDVPHSWLCDGRLLRLHDPRHKGNLKIFQEQWKRGQPVLVSCVNKLVNPDLWKPETFCKEFGRLENDLVNCRNGNVIVGNPMSDFWEGFESIENRLVDEDNQPILLKLKDWPPGDDFSDLLPSRFQDLMQALPLPEYTRRNGSLNLASRLPDFLVRPDLGPKMYNAYGSARYPKEGTTNLHLDISDAVNVLVYVGVPSDGAGGRKEHEEAAVRAIDEAGCDSITKRRVREVHELPGALWQIYDAHDADKIRDFLNKVAKENGETIEPDHDSIHDQSWYLDEELRDRLYKEYGVQGYTIVQCLGDAIFIPAGAPHQVRNLHSCVKVAEDFVSPEHLNHCFRLTQEFRQLSDTHSNHEDKLQVKNIIYHAVKDSIAVLREMEPEDKK